MAAKHPYTSSGSGAIVQTINHLRKSFPATVTAETLKKLGFAPLNEAYILGILRFIGAIDEAGNKTAKAATVFHMHDAEEFQKAFGELVEVAYKDLFSLHGKTAWDLSTDQLISFFRGADHTSDLVGKRQAQTFRALASLSGHGEPVKTVATKPGSARKGEAKPKKAAPTAKRDTGVSLNGNGGTGNGVDRGEVGLTVRIEINLPASGDQETYDRIFKSIRENLLRG